MTLARRPTREAQIARARAKAVKLLAARDRSRAELLRLLARSGSPAEVAGHVADELTRSGLLNDARLAAHLTQRELARAPAGEPLLSIRLHSRGIPETEATAAVSTSLSRRNEQKETLAFARKLLSADSKAAADPTGARRRLAGKLGRRGLDDDLIGEILDQLIPLQPE